MPNTREKLIELLDEVQHYGISTSPSLNYVYNGAIADHLIANGVMVQEQLRDHYWATEQAYKNGYEKGKADALKWISVKDRLPEKPGYYLTYWHGHSCPEGMVDVLNFDGTVFPWTTLWTAVKNEVTHWMPLPEPPKGE